MQNIQELDQYSKIYVGSETCMVTVEEAMKGILPPDDYEFMASIYIKKDNRGSDGKSVIKKEYWVSAP